MTTNERRRALVPRAPVSSWHSRIITGRQVGEAQLPSWLTPSYEVFREQVMHDRFPCFFGTRAERRGEMFYTFSPHDDWSSLADSVAHFCELSARKEFNRANLALFFEPHAQALDLDDARAFCWRVLQHLHDCDIAQGAADKATSHADPTDPAWEFTAFETEMFVVGCSPSYVKRRSRNLGPGIVMLFQPRRVFVDLVTKKAISGEARNEVRRRLLEWDGFQHHPDLGTYGDPTNLEWKQYFLDDENIAEPGDCPFISRFKGTGVFPSLSTRPETLVELLRMRAQATPDARALTFLDKDQEHTLSYAELEQKVKLVAAALQLRAAPGERVLLLLPSGLDYVVSFFACLYARLVAVPAYPVPAGKQSPEQRARLAGMLRDATPEVLICERDHVAGLAVLDPAREAAWFDAHSFVPDYALQLAAADFIEPAPEELAFLQYTSGSTAAPKGVMVTHANVMANEAAISDALQFRTDDVFVSWLPLYHDMGLIGGMLSPIYNGVPLVLMSPLAFLQAPVRWLRVMSEQRGTLSGGPDFAFQLALSRVRDEELKGLDLSRWRVAFCGAEPIRASTLRSFAERFAKLGFSADALLPCYGLAEATLMVTSTRTGEGARDGALGASTYVDCGPPALGQQLRVSDPESGIELAEGEVGELWVAGASVALGYWHNEAETARVFRTLTLEDGSEARFLRTGDLGFVREGRAFVTGRLKDLIILRGQNIYPQDLERVIEAAAPELRGGRVAAFAVRSEHGEAIGVAAELSSSAAAQLRREPRAAAQLVDRVQSALSTALAESAALVLLLKPGAMPRTSSGKLQRSACAAGYERGELQVLHEARRSAADSSRHVHEGPRTLTEHLLTSLWNELLGARERSVHADFFTEGGDSVRAARLLARIERMLGPGLQLAQLYEARTIAQQALLLQQRLPLPVSGPQIPRVVEQAKDLPLTAAQRGLWFQHQLDPSSAAYTVCTRLGLDGALDSAALRVAFLWVLERHAILRARFHESAGDVRWSARPAAEALSWRELGPDDAEVLRALMLQPFQLGSEPLVRVVLTRHAKDKHTLTVVLPHLIADGASAAIMWQELGQAYELALSGTGAAHRLPALPISYADYALWQQDPARSDSESRALQYWSELLGPELAATAAPGRLALARADVAHPDESMRLSQHLPADLTAELRVLGRGRGTTLAVTLLAAFDVLLSRYTSERTITLGVPASARTKPKLEQLVGHFVNLFIHRISLRPEQTFAQLLHEVRERCIAAAAHQDVPFERVAAGFSDRDAAPVQIAFNHQHIESSFGFGQLAAKAEHGSNVAAAFDWTLDVRESRGDTLLVLEFRRQRFDDAFMQQVLADYVAILRQVVTHPDGPLGGLRLHTAREHTQPATFEPVSVRFERSAARQPEAAAVSCGDDRLTYAQLASWSHVISARLRELGVQPEERVGLCLGRSIAIAPSVLGVLHSGAAFVPLDAAFPRARLAGMIEDARIRCVLVDDAGRQALAGLGDGLRLISCADGPALAALAPRPVHEQQLAYVLFTSGSTGRPKGVEISQRALSLDLDDHISTFQVTERDCVTQFSTLSFDIALEQLLPPLTLGGRVVLREADTWGWEELRNKLTNERVTITYLPTAYLSAFTHELENTRAASDLRLVLTAGEALGGDVVRRWRNSDWRNIDIGNIYGPTECTIATSIHMASDADAKAAVVPIGKSFPGRRAYVLDADGCEVPPGGVGELCIGGLTVGRGYASRASATAERFVPDPFTGPDSGDAGTRLYRTGDRCRRKPDGTFEYLGRLDLQIKLRGQRIELGEIESALRACEGVRDAAVILHGTYAQRRLVGFVVGSCELQALQAPLRERLPAVMIPSSLLALDALPRLPNGKLNRRALAEIPLADELPSGHDLPLTAAEHKLLEIARAVLGRSDLGVSDDFFAAGGDSITILQLVGRARGAGYSITARAVFEHPTMRALAAQAERGAHTPQLGEHATTIDPSQYPALLARSGIALDNVECVYPATALQAGLLFHAGFGADDGYYLDQLCLNLRGALDPQLFEQAYRAAVARHDILRTAFVSSRSGNLQVVLRTVALPFRYEDASALSAEAYAAHLEALRQEEAQRGFELQQPPLSRLVLVQRPDGAHDLIWTFHHAILDGWSSSLLASEIFADHVALRAGAAVSGERAPRFEDYVAWLSERSGAREFWREELASWDEPATLARAFGAASQPEPGTHHLRQHLAPALAERLTLAAARARVTLPALVQGAWGLLLAHAGDRSQAVFGSTFSHRPPEVAGSERMLGLFIHTVPVCVRVDPAQELDGLLREVQRTAAEVREHGTLSLAELQRWAGTPGRALFDSVLVFENYPLPEALRAASSGSDLSVTASSTRDRTHYPLTLSFYPPRAGEPAMELDWEWDGAQLDGARVQELSGLYLQLLEQLAADGSKRVGELLLREASPQPIAAHAYRSIAARVQATALAQPQATALVCDGDATSYAVLEAWSNQLAHALQRAGVKPEARVGVSVARSAGMVASLLGVWKAGGGYVPLDPTYPAARLAEMLDGVEVVLCDEHSAGLFSDHERVYIERVSAEATSGSFREPHREQLAYVIYTSGSTGRPKGVAVSHASLSAHIDDFLSCYAISADDRVLFSSTINFDVSLHELFPALIAGGRVIMRGPEAWSLEALTSELREQRVTFARVPTAYWQAWTKRLQNEAFPGLRQITVGGEGLAGDALARWLAGPLAHVALDNLYGPTETTVAALRHRAGHADASYAIVPIGQRFASRSARVIGQTGQELLPGGVGELCIGGPTVARGYLGMPALTAERFVPDPHGNGTRVYRSGDRCRERADGCVEFLGRADAQVKLRGYRIELGEIESVLRAADGVDAAVVEIKGEGEARRLVAYVTSAQTLESATLKSWVSSQLPAYMVPASYLQLTALPLLPSGKVDRRALPEPELPTRALIAPRTQLEQLLWQSFCSVLKHDDVSIDDDFFELGGDSILCLQVVAHLREAGFELTPKALFEHPTIEGAARVALPFSGRGLRESVPGALPLTPIQARFFERHPHGPQHWNQSLLLRAASDLDLRVLEQVIALWTERHDALRQRFDRDASGRWQAWIVVEAERGNVESCAVADEAALLAAANRVQASLDLQNGPLLRAAHFTLPNGEARLLFVVHHLAVDGVSWRVLLEELDSAFAQAERGESVSLPAASTPWSAWAHALEAHIEHTDLQSALDYFSAALSGNAPQEQAEVDRSYAATSVLTTQLSRAATRDLLAMAPRAYRMRVDEVLLTALTQALADESGELLVELEGHGREDIIEGADLSRTLGWFTTLFPVRLRAESEPRAALIAIKEQLRAVPGKGLPWSLLREQKSAAGEAARRLTPPAVSFNYLGVFDHSLRSSRFAFANEDAGSPVDPTSEMGHPLDINALVRDGELTLSFRYMPALFGNADMAALRERFERALARLVEHGLKAAPTPTAADFPLSGLHQAQLEKSGLVLAQVVDLYPATAMQSGLLFHSASQAADGVYVYQLRLELQGALNVEAWEGAWRDVVARHDMLRTAFVWVSEQEAPLQVVQREVEVPFAFHDWSNAGADYDARLQAYCADDLARGFNAASAPLLRLHVFRRSERRFDFVWSMHHALADGWSSSRILDEILRFYGERLGTGPAGLSARGPRYREYVAWLQRQDSGEAFFRGLLAQVDEPATISACLTALGNTQAAPAISERKLHRDQAFGVRLKQAAQRQRVSVATLAQAAWALVLARHADRSQVAFGVTVSGRPMDLPEADRIVGPFLNTLPMWVELDGKARVSTWLSELHAAGARLRQYEHVSLRELQRWAGMPIDALFDSILVVENYPLDRAALDGLAARAGLAVAGLEVANRTHYRMSLTLTLEPVLELMCEWDERMPEATALQLGEEMLHALEMLSGLEADDARPLRSLLSAAGAQPELPAVPTRPYRSVVARIDAWVNVRPEVAAVICEGRKLTYAALGLYSDQLLLQLLATERTDPRQERIGLAVARSVELVPALVAIWKAGAAYVPLDPAYPVQRLQSIARAAGVRRVLTDASTHPQLAAALPDLELIVIPAPDPDLLENSELIEDADALDWPEPRPEDLAYVLSTSGSTGEPKGVMLSQRALALHIDDYIATYDLDANDRVYQFSTINVDMAAEQLFTALSVGATVVMRGPELPSWNEFHAQLHEHNVSVLDLPSAFWQAFVAEGPPALPNLRLLTVSGEALPPASLAAHRAGPLGHVRLENSYGPTEAAITTHAHRTTAEDALAASVPLGRAFPCRSAYVVDRFGELCAPGALGELCIGGAALAQGYDGKPGLTAERFVPDPFSPGARMYRTGDRCRQLQDGCVVFAGRADDQVKVRGYRIELAEIESALRACSGVRQAAVIARKDHGTTRLFAYVSGQAEPAVMLQALQQLLPPFAVPQAIVCLPELPRRQNGKLDRAALPVPELRAQEERAPQSDVEAKLLLVFRDVLGRQDLGLEDDFLAAGGDSISSLRVVARAHELGLRLTPRQVLDHPTVAALARVARPRTALDLRESYEPLPLTPIQAAFFAQHGSSPTAHYNQGVLLAVHEAIDVAALEAALTLLMQRHASLRLRFERNAAGELQQRVARVAPALRVTSVDLRAQDNWQAELTAVAERLQTSFDLSAGPLMAAGYFRVPAAAGGEAGRILIAVHHLAIDAVSFHVLLDELAQAYDSLARGEAAQLPEPSTPWSAWVNALATYAQSDVVQAELPQWTTDTAAVGGTSAQATSGEAVELSLDFDAAWTARLTAEAPRAYRAQVDELLLAALVRALASTTREKTWRVDLERHGREPFAAELDVSRTLGWFTSFQPVVLQTQATSTETLLETKRVLRAAPLGGLHAGLLRELGTADARAAMRALPSANIAFNYLGRVALRADSRFGLADEPCGRFVSGHSPLSHALEVNASLRESGLRVRFTLDPQFLSRDARELLSQSFTRELRALLSALEQAAPALHVSDFPLAQLSAEALAALQLSAADTEDLLPATPLQQGLLFQTLLARESSNAHGDAYVNQLCISVRGPLDRARLRDAWENVVSRHAILRTRFAWAHGGELLQVVTRSGQRPLPWIEIDASRERDYASFLAELLRADWQRGVDATRDPLRLQVIAGPAGDNHLLLTNHHALLDGWSSALLLDDVRRAYAQEPARASRPFRDYVVWLQKQPSAERFWREQLAQLEAAASLTDVFDEPEAAPQDLLSARIEQHFSRELTTQLRAFAQRTRVTLSSVLHGAWALLLSRYADRERVVFGTTVSGRPAALSGVEQMLGLFIHSLPLCLEVPERAKVGTWFGALQNQLLELQQHAHTPLYHLQQLAGRAGAPLFDSLLIFENFPLQPMHTDELQFEPIAGVDRTHYPLSLSISADDTLAIVWTWQPEALSRRTVELLQAQLEHVLSLLAAGTTQRLHELQLIAAAPPQLHCSSAPQPQLRVFEQLRVRAEQTPRAIALSAGSQVLDYRSVYQRVSALAQAIDVPAEARVGVCVERGVDLPIALLAVMAAGGAYVPLDPSYPAERLAFMLEDAGIELVVADRACAARHAALFADQQLLVIGDQRTTHVLPRVHEEQLAYVLYTSGSTGRPKGVAVRHAALERFLASFATPSSAPQLTAADTWLSVTSPSFDISALELFAPLTVGARVVVATQAEVSDPQLLAASVVEHAATVVQATPTLWRELIAMDLQLAGLRVLAGGEALSEDLAEALLTRGATLWNMYGPTETTIWSSCALIEQAAHIHLGAALPGTTLAVVDRAGRPAALGGRGELCIGGDNLARGYLGRPALSAERFVPTADGGRSYRTGDVCKITLDGQLIFVGRSDAQLKLRGHRIELEEIESVLRTLPGVLDAAVIVAGEAERRSLLGFVTGDADPQATLAALALQLPAYMVPARLTQLAELPRTLNAKLARNALQALAELPTESFEAPATATERKLAAIWREILGREQIGREDNFFALGGHSLRAVRLATQAQHAFGREVTLRSIFDAASLRELASSIDAAPAARSQMSLPLVAAGPRAPLSLAQERLWFLWKLEPHAPTYNMVGALQLTGTLDVAALQGAVDALVRRHENLRTRFEERSGELSAVVQERVPAVFSQQVAEADLQRQLERAARVPFDLARGPLLRVQLFSRDAWDHVLLVSVHHIVCDGGSVDKLLSELGESYAALSSGEELSAAPLPRQYRDFAHWERAQDRAAQLAYWRERLAASGGALELPADRVRRGMRDARGGTVTLPVPSEVVRALDALASQGGCTRFIVMLGALDVLLYRYTGSRDLRVGIPVSARRHAETDDVIGLFVNTLVHRAQLSPEQGFTSFLREIEQQMVRDIEHSDVPFAQLVAELSHERNLSETPLFNVNFNYESSAALPQLRALEVRPLPLTEADLAFDLMFDVDADDTKGTLELTLSYVHDRFEHATADRLLRDYLGLLAQLNERALIADLQCQSASDSQQLVPTLHPYRSVYTRFMEQADARPDATALVFESEQLSYRELAAWAARIRGRLYARGLQRQERVAVCLDRSPEVVAAILGILSAGASYVPLDPRYPAARLRQTALDAGVRLVVQVAADGGELWQGFELVSAGPGADEAAIEHAREMLPGELAYLIYTSGSTGTPKGVAVTHENLSRLLDAAANAEIAHQCSLQYGPDDVWSLFHSPAFDFSVFELFGALCSGGKLVVVPYAATRDPAEFRRLLAAEGVSILCQTPSAFAALLPHELAAETPLSQLRAVVFGGEKLDPGVLAPWALARGSELPALLNMYGITETTVHVTQRCLTEELRAAANSGESVRSLIGGPLDDLQLYVLDDELNQVPFNGVGELYVSGPGLARGYWRQPGLTASRFIPNPFAAEGGSARLYASGDRARRLPDGDIEYLGRSDFQVKIRGFRIELGEIEASLREHPSVREAVVLARPSELGPQLCAFVSGPTLADNAELRRFLDVRLPVHMLPAHFQRVATWPLTENGKLDRTALLALPLSQLEAAEQVLPETANEQLLCELFAELLGLPSVSADADFFHIGGHSLIAVRAAAALSDALGAPVEVAALFEHSSVRALAQHLDTLAADGGAALAGMDELLDALED